MRVLWLPPIRRVSDGPPYSGFAPQVVSLVGDRGDGFLAGDEAENNEPALVALDHQNHRDCAANLGRSRRGRALNLAEVWLWLG